jgi:hypothetical protein
MKSLRKILLSSIVLIASFDTFAQSESTFYPGWYGNINLGSAKTTLNDGNQNFTFMNIGGAFGYRFSELFATEFFMSFSTNGERDDFVSYILGQEVEAEYDAVGFYATLQSKGDIYAKGRAGLIESRFTYTSKGYGDESENDIGLSYGIGGGVKNGRLAFELDYLVMPEVDDPIFDNTSYDSKLIMLSIGTSF